MFIIAYLFSLVNRIANFSEKFFGAISRKMSFKKLLPISRFYVIITDVQSNYSD